MNSYEITYHILYDSGQEFTRTTLIMDLNEARAKTRLQAQICMDDVKQFTITDCRLKRKIF